MKKAGILLVVISSIVFLGGGLTLFFSETEGTIKESTTKTLTTAGSATKGAPGGSYTEITFLEYTYIVNYKKLTGSSIRFSGRRILQSPTFNRPDKIKVFYPKIFPFISIIDRGSTFFVACLLLFLGIFCIELKKWVEKIKRKAPINPS
jgi:hypothetical protein